MINLAVQKAGVRRDKCLFLLEHKKGGRLTPPAKGSPFHRSLLVTNCNTRDPVAQGGSPPCPWVKRSAVGRLKI